MRLIRRNASCWTGARVAAVAIVFTFAQAPVRAAPVVSPGGLAELPISADRCAISLALTGRHIPGCGGHPETDLGAARRLPPSGFDVAAAPLDSAPAEQGYFIRFPFNSNALTPEYEAHLARLAAVLSSAQLQNSCVKLVGHTDSIGSDQFNMRLSKTRAQRVAAYLALEGGVAMERIQTASLGEKHLIKGLPGPHPLNRRVEILARHNTGKGCK